MIGSGDLTAYPLLKEISKREKPLLLSTGLAHEQEVVDAINYVRGVNSLYKSPEYIAVLQCTSMYPIPFRDANLRVMNRLRQLTNCTVGYSDHTEGSKALEIAVAMGAQVLEFHFTDDRAGKSFRDHKVSLTQEEVQELILRLKDVEELKGRPIKQPLEVEGDHKISFRRAVYPAVDIPRDTMIKAEHLVVLRPNHGISAEYFDQLLGKKATRDLKQFEKLSQEDFK
jgi:N-acetylneuraminate synthase/N,N'-diacetyllegionaminate synthase